MKLKLCHFKKMTESNFASVYKTFLQTKINLITNTLKLFHDDE